MRASVFLLVLLFGAHDALLPRMSSCRYSRHLGRMSAEENKEEAVSTAPAERSDEEAEEAEDDDKDVFDMSTLSSRAKIANMRAPPPELLSEQWKEDEESDSSALVAAAAGVFLAVAFIAVAGQVPVGDDLSSFSYNKGDRDLLTPDQVKAKYAAVLGNNE